MVRPMDLSKFRRGITKSIPGISSGYNDPKVWVDTGSYLLNKLISNDFYKGIPLEGKFCMFAGNSGAGKSLIVSGNLVKHCQQNGIFPVIVDTENAIDKQWLIALGVDPEDGLDDEGKPNGKEPKIMKFNVATIEDLAKFIGEFVDDYQDNYKDLPKSEKPHVALIIDSLGMLITSQMVEQADAGTIQGDMGIKAKKITHTLRTTLAKINGENIGLWATNHVYTAQDKYSLDTISGGQMLEFASSIIVQMDKLLLKEDDEGNKLKGGEVAGIRSSVSVRKSRYAKPFEKMQILIPYEGGMDKYSGLFDFFEKKGVLVKEGNRYAYSVEGEVIFKDFRKNYTHEMFDRIMQEWKEDDSRIGVNDIDEEQFEE